MIELAREARGLTQTKLADLLDVSQAQISKVEQGLKSIDEDLLKSLSEVLKFPVQFFQQDHRVYVPGIGFDRNRKSLGVKKRKMIDAKINIQRMHIQNLLSAVDLISENIPRLDNLDETIYAHESEYVANSVRQYYKLPRGPIENLTKTLEDSGIFIIHTDFGTRKQDGITFQAPEIPPIIFLNKNLPPDRLRFTIAHELGHIVMHEMPTEKSEEEADRFASEFLLPSEQIREDLLDCKIHHMHLDKLKDLKFKWGVSFQTLIKKAFDLKLINQKQRQYFYVQMSRNGYSRNHEPECGLEQEKPTLLKNLFDLYRNRLDYSLTDLSLVLPLDKDEMVNIYDINDSGSKLRLVTKNRLTG